MSSQLTNNIVGGNYFEITKQVWNKAPSSNNVILRGIQIVMYAVASVFVGIAEFAICLGEASKNALTHLFFGEKEVKQISLVSPTSKKAEQLTQKKPAREEPKAATPDDKRPNRYPSVLTAIPEEEEGTSEDEDAISEKSEKTEDIEDDGETQFSSDNVKELATKANCEIDISKINLKGMAEDLKKSGVNLNLHGLRVVTKIVMTQLTIAIKQNQTVSIPASPLLANAVPVAPSIPKAPAIPAAPPAIPAAPPLGARQPKIATASAPASTTAKKSTDTSVVSTFNPDELLRVKLKKMQKDEAHPNQKPIEHKNKLGIPDLASLLKCNKRFQNRAAVLQDPNDSD